MEIIQANSIHTFLDLFPQFAGPYHALSKRFDSFVNSFELLYQEFQKAQGKAEFAAAVKAHPLASHLFQRPKFDTAQAYFRTVKAEILLRLLPDNN